MSTNVDNNCEYVLYVGARLHTGKSKKLPTEEQMKKWITQLLTLASYHDTINFQIHVAIAVEQYDPLIQLVQSCFSSISESESIIIIPVSPWGNFIPALNALVQWATKSHNNSSDNVQKKKSLLGFLSMETTTLSQETLKLLCQHHLDDDNTLVVGPVLTGHDFIRSKCNHYVSEQPLNGRTCPWNTCAVWNLTKLSKTGFLQVSECYNDAGIEEVAVVALHQKLEDSSKGSTSKAKLIQLPSDSITWSINDFANDPKRLEWHSQKMQSKLSRAYTQLQRLFPDNEDCNDYGIVQHINLT